MFYLLHGEDEFRRSEALAQMKEKMGDPAMADLNTVIFDGHQVTLGELIHACNAVPFLADRRLVIVKGLLAKLESERSKMGGEETAFERGLVDYLQRVPESTRLVFLEDKSIGEDNPIHQLALAHELGYVKEFKPLQGKDLRHWIAQRAEKKGGQILPSAVEELAAFVGNDLRLLDQEIDKLMAYVNGVRPINTEDVRLLVSYVQEASIFEMVDALGRRDGERAIELLHELLDRDVAPPYLLYMITRQFRIMLQVKELESRRVGRREIGEELKLRQFIVDKGLQQARNFSFEKLEAAYRKLLETDMVLKTGRTEPVLALDMLIVELSGEGGIVPSEI